jgi:hypothetical protein
MQRVTYFKTSDGQQFPSSKLAKSHEAQLSLDKLIVAWFADSDALDATEIRDYLVAGSWTLINVLSDIARRAPLEPEGEQPAAPPVEAVAPHHHIAA